MDTTCALEDSARANVVEWLVQPGSGVAGKGAAPHQLPVEVPDARAA